jgi:hypothetical protein
MTAPLVPPAVDLRDFPFMPLDVRRLLNSETWVLGTAEEKVAAINLWCEAWHQIPAASLPNNDRMLAHLSKAGDRWKKVREHALRGWLLCDDGRLYHSVIAEKAVEAWEKKVRQRERGRRGNAVRWGSDRDADRSPSGTPEPVQEGSHKDRTRIAEGSPDDPARILEGSPKDRKGQGQGQGEKERAKEKTRATLGVADLAALGVDPQVASDFLTIRKAKRAPLTQTALDAMRVEGTAAGLTLDAVVRICVARGWASFQAEWYANAARAGPVNGSYSKPSIEERNKAHAAEFLRRQAEAERTVEHDATGTG